MRSEKDSQRSFDGIGQLRESERFTTGNGRTGGIYSSSAFDNPDRRRMRRVWRIFSICSGPASFSASTFRPMKLPIPMLMKDQSIGSIPSGRARLLVSAGTYR